MPELADRIRIRTRRGRGFPPLPLQLLNGSLRQHRRGLAEVAVDEGQGNPGVRGIGAVDGAPGGECSLGLLEAGPLPAGQQIAGWDHQTIRAGAEPPLDKLMKAG